ncbi:MAG: type I restriction enzyme HsdR N-terminal domain-containing protein [Ardenticatenaceae bacterium]|nr:type I restriction enzyme HsdR N-terminal domain-containing protein [Ardenticatenaceae bacterium]
MDFIDRIQQLANRIPQQMEHCQTEEATKNALVMPFINALGYDVFNLGEVIPEFTADIGIKKGEKVDYAIMMDGKPIMLFECKWAGSDLNKVHASQLFRYFNAVQTVRFGILTNGIIYRFHTDLDFSNRMDEKPFFEFNMMAFQDRDIVELKKFTKSAFNLDEIITTASELKYTAAIKKILSAEFESPSDEYVTFLTRQVYSGKIMQSVRDQFSEIIRKAMRSFMNDKINQRLKQAIDEDVVLPQTSTPVTESEEEVEADSELERKAEIHTTEDEIEGFFAIKSILRDTINVKRVHMRDTKSYCGILLDDNNRKPIVRLRFNRDQKYLALINEDKSENRVPIETVDDIYSYATQIIETVNHYVSE